MAKKKKTNQPQQQISPKKYIFEATRKVPVYECLINEGWREAGLAQIMVARRKQHGNFIVGNYVLDFFCLGLKNTLYQHNMDEFEYKSHRRSVEVQTGFNWEKIEPNYCFNLIYGAIEYAEDLGFQPNKDFEVTEYILDDVESIEYEEIEFGKNGKPYYVAGPYDDVKRIQSILNRSVGEGNYEILLPLGIGNRISNFDKLNANHFDDNDYSDEPHVSMIGVEFDFSKALNINLEKDKNFLLKADAIESLIDIELNQNDFIIYPEEDYFSIEEYVDILTYGFNKYVEKSNHTNLYLTISGDGNLEEYKDELVLSFFTTFSEDDISIETNLQFPTFMEHFPTLEKHPFLYEKIKTSEMTKNLDQLIITFYNNDWDKKYVIEAYITYGDKEYYGETEDHVSVGLTIDLKS